MPKEQFNYSIIIPHYNIHQLLRRLLYSIPIREDLQVIVIDDCSTNNLDEYEKLKSDFSYVEFYSTGINGGGGKARNIGLKHARGKYVIFADSDDYFNYCFNEILNKYILSEADIIYFAANSVDTDTYQSTGRGLVQTQLINKAIHENNPKILLHKITAPWGKFIRKSIVDDNRISFQESIVFNDMYFSLLIDSKVKTVECDNHAIYCVTYRGNSVSSVSTPDKEIKKMEVASYYCKAATNLNCKIQPYYIFIGPTFSVAYRNRWKSIYKDIRKPWNDIGLSNIQIYWYFSKYILFTNVLSPLIRIINVLKYR